MACAGAVASEPQQADSAGLPAFPDRHQPSCSAVPLIFHGERPELMETVIHMVTETGLCRLCPILCAPGILAGGPVVCGRPDENERAQISLVQELPTDFIGQSRTAFLAARSSRGTGTSAAASAAPCAQRVHITRFSIGKFCFCFQIFCELRGQRRWSNGCTRERNPKRGARPCLCDTGAEAGFDAHLPL